MDIAQLRREPHLSASAMNDYMECSLLYRFTRIDNLKPEFRSDALEFGSAIHKVLAEFYQEKMSGSILDLKDLRHSFEIHWKTATSGEPQIKYREGKSYEILLKEGKELLGAYHEALPKDEFIVLGIEEPFRFSLDSLPVPIVGVFDLIEEDETGTIIVTDWKTASKAYSTKEIDSSFQLTVYSLAARMNGLGNRELLLRFDVLIKTKKPKFDQYWTSRSESDQKRAIKKIHTIWEGFRREYSSRMTPAGNAQVAHSRETVSSGPKNRRKDDPSQRKATGSCTVPERDCSSHCRAGVRKNPHHDQSNRYAH